MGGSEPTTLLVLLLKPLRAATCESERLRSLTSGDGAMPNRGWVDVGLSLAPGQLKTFWWRKDPQN